MNSPLELQTEELTGDDRGEEGRSALDVLVVDDDESCRELTAQVVEHLGYRCRMAADGNEALRMLAKSPADVIISDWDMPGISGAELCRRTRRVADARYTYFILLTGVADGAHRIGAMAAGADEYERKPASLEALQARLLTASRVIALHRRLEAPAAGSRVDTRSSNAEWGSDAPAGIGSRVRLDEALVTLVSRAARYGHGCSLALCRVDAFGAYVADLGDAAADAALRRIAEEMRRNLREVDDVFRYGIDEFVVLLVEQPLDAAELAMNRMRDAIERLAIAAPGPGGVLTLSIGIARLDLGCDHHGADWLQRAREALRDARAAGRNRVLSTMPPPV